MFTLLNMDMFSFAKCFCNIYFIGLLKNNNYVIKNRATRHIFSTSSCLQRRDDGNSGDKKVTGRGDKRRGGGDKGGHTTQEIACPKCGAPFIPVDTFVSKYGQRTR